MTTDQLLGQLKELGIELYLNSGKPMLRPAHMAGPVLLKALAWHRDAILKRMGVDPETAPPPPVIGEDDWERVNGRWIRKGLSDQDRRASARSVFR